MEIQIKAIDALVTDTERVVYLNVEEAKATKDGQAMEVEFHWLNCRIQITVKE